jgi:hypothetical protein
MNQQSAEVQFLQRLPTAIKLEQRYALEAIGHSLTAIRVSYKRLQNHALHHDVFECSKTECRASWFVDAWAIVDATYALSTLLRSKQANLSLPESKRYEVEFTTASLLRNKMDHLAQNLNNLSNRNLKVLPVFGLLSYFKTREGGGDMVLVTSGFIAGDGAISIPNPAGCKIETPVGYFHFSAFDSLLDLSKINFHATEIITFFNGDFARIAHEQLHHAAKVSGIDPKAALEPGPTGLVVSIEMSNTNE